MTRWFWGVALVLGCVGFMGCNDDEDPGGACADDSSCARGEICMDGACSAQACNRLGDCPGSGRTCLFDLKQCSPKECADAVGGAELTCPAERPICIEGGSFPKTCVADVACNAPADCAGLGAGWSCCGGQCSMDCQPQDMLTPPDMGPTDMAPPGDGGGVIDMGQPADMGPPVERGLCSPCTDSDQCAASLGEGARCTALGADGAFCASPCAGPGDCPVGYRCEANGLNLCLPDNLRCVECLREPCPAGLACDTMTGECVEPRGPCGPCSGDVGCMEGLRCAEVENGRFCLEPCADGACADAENMICQDEVCQPESGRCDPCGGRCEGATPYCIEASGECGECGIGVPCGEGLNCDQATNTCVEGEGCLGDVDCLNPDTPVCFGGQCVACLQDTDCPPRMACNGEQQCEPDPCRGVECQRGSECDPGTGRCNPGCQAAADCADPMLMDCNVETGQCFLTNGTCDLAGGDAVCAPGSTCTPGLDPNVGVCDCALSDPMNPMSPPRIACHTGQMCTQFIPDLPGCCGGCGFF